MIRLLTGENSFEIERALQRVAGGFNGRPETFDGSALELRQLPDLLMGGTLFTDKRLVIIKNLSQNKVLWNVLPEWAGRVSDDVQLVLVEPQPDKRTKAYKALQKAADIQEFTLWTARDTAKAETWVLAEAQKLGATLDRASVRALVARVGTEQWQLYHALEKLAILDKVTPSVIDEIIEANPVENVFNLFEAALRRDAREVKRMIGTLQITEDPYRLFGLLSGQAFQLAALAVSDKPSAEVAKDLGAHPFALSKLAPYAKKIGAGGAKKIITAFAEADEGMKTSVAEPWLLIERALIKTAFI